MKKIFNIAVRAFVAMLPAVSLAQQLTVGTLATNGLREPFGLTQDNSFNTYFSDSANGVILEIDGTTEAMTVLTGQYGISGHVDGPAYLAEFSNPQGIVFATLGGTNGLVVADTDNGLVRFVNINDGSVTTLAGNTNGPLADSANGLNATFRYPYGVTSDGNGNIYVADWGNNAIRVVNLNNPNFPVTTLSVTSIPFSLYRPEAVAFASSNLLWVADTGNNSIRLLTLTSATTASQTTYMGSLNHLSTGRGTMDSGFGPKARFNSPGGLYWDPSVGLLISDTATNSIRLATNNPVYGATNYAVVTYAGTPGVPGDVNGNALSATFDQPYGLVKDIPNGRYLVADLANRAVRILQYGPILGPCPPPSIGYITFQYDQTVGGFVSVLNTDPPFTFNNDVPIGIQYPGGYNAGYTLDGTQPTKASPSPNRYMQIDTTMLLPSVSVTIPVYSGNLSINAFVWNPGQPSSPVTNALFHFITAAPLISGQNSAQFQVSDITSNAVLYYTSDGSDPTTSGTVSTSAFNTNGVANFSFGASNFVFTCFARRVDSTHNYTDSGVVSNYFALSNNVPNRITFGGATNSVLHSAFLARPGQYFYAPVTLEMLPNFGKIYSLQFNASATNGFTNVISGKSVPPIANPAGMNFDSMLMAKVPPDEGTYFPPADGNWYLPIGNYLEELVMGTTNLVSSDFVDTNNNLIGVSFLYRTGLKYLFSSGTAVLLDFDTTLQDLTAYSIAHDALFMESGPLIVVGAYSFPIPTNSAVGDQYFIQLGSASATQDGVGAPGAGITLVTPPQSQVVNVTSPPYLVGDAAPFYWLNAGDFGDGNLDNSDVMQVYEAYLGINLPPANSDLYAAMDSSGGWGTLDPANGYYINSGTADVFQQQAMWDGNDLTINTNAFGDGFIDINDVYVTLRRSLDPSLVWFKRYWTNNMFVAVPTTNYAYNSNTPNAKISKALSTKVVAGAPPSYLNSSVQFAAGDSVSGAGTTVTIPITANILGSYPIRVLGLSVTVRALDGSPGISNTVAFAPSTALGAPTLSMGARSPGNFNDAWLNSTIAGLSGDATIGTLTVTVPATANSASAYDVEFDTASASPNGLAIFPKTTYTGLITTVPRTNSVFGDGIPDSWRLRWFGTVNNVLSASNACPSGDGVPNWKKYVAGVDPNVPNDFPSLNAKSPVPSGSTTAIQWPSVLGKQYVILRAPSLFGSPWSVLATNTGTGGNMEFDDNSTSGVKFYRVEILP